MLEVNGHLSTSRADKEEEWTTLSSWRYYQQSPVTTSPQIWRKKQDLNTGIYDNLHSIQAQKKIIEERKKKVRTKVMTPWRSNQLYQGARAKAEYLSDTEADRDWKYAEDTVSIGSDQEVCTGGLEIELYPSLTSLDKVSQSNSSASGKSVGKISQFLNSLFSRRKKASKKEIKLKRTSSCPQDLSARTNEQKKEGQQSPPVPPRSVSLSGTNSREKPKKKVVKEELHRTKSDANIKVQMPVSVKDKKAKRQAPAPPNNLKETSNRQLPVASRNTPRSISIINGKNDEIDNHWNKHLNNNKLIVNNAQANYSRSDKNVVRRKKRTAPMPPTAVKKEMEKTENDVKNDVNNELPNDLIKNIVLNQSSTLDIYATWPKNQDPNVNNAKLEVSVNKTKISPKRWSYTASSRSDHQENDSSDPMLKIYVPMAKEAKKVSPPTSSTGSSSLNGFRKTNNSRKKHHDDNQNELETALTGDKNSIKNGPLRKSAEVDVKENDENKYRLNGYYEKSSKPVWSQVNSKNVKSMAAIFDDMSAKEPPKRVSVTQNRTPRKEGVEAKSSVSKSKSNVKLRKNGKADEEKKGEKVKEEKSENSVENKPPTGFVKGPKRRKARKKDHNVTRKRLSPLFETSGQKNDLEEEIASLLKDLPQDNQIKAGFSFGGTDMASSGSVHVNRLFRKLSTAISSGQYERAAILARQLAMLKAQCATTQLDAVVNKSAPNSNATAVEEKIISVSMYIEDRDTHHGPIPLNLSPKMSLRLLKKMVEYHFGFPVMNQRWILGKALATEDNLNLSEFGVTQGCAIFLYLVNEPPSPSLSRRKSHSKSPTKCEGENVDERSAHQERTLKRLQKSSSVNSKYAEKHTGSNSQNGARPKEPGKYQIKAGKTTRNISPSPDRLGNNVEFENSGKIAQIEEEEVLNDEPPADDVTADYGRVNGAKESEDEDDGEDDGEDDDETEEEHSEEEEETEQKVEPVEAVPEMNKEKTPPVVPELPKALRTKLYDTKDGGEDNKENVTEVIENDKEEASGLDGKTDAKDSGFKSSKVEEKENKENDLLKQMELREKLDLIPNIEQFECIVCMSDIPPLEGVVLRECLHNFCKECLANAVQYCEEPMIKCPYRDNSYSCQSHLLDREIKNLVTPAIYERHLQRSIRRAQSQDSNSFHCKTPNCSGWCLYENSVHVFNCPVCHKQNCLNCQAIHEDRNCLQYQEEQEFQQSKNDDVRKTKKFLNSMIVEGTAMRCPKCQVVVLKKWGCDWLKCCVCDTEICWVTKGPRWGPAGKGDTSGGCRCRVNGLKCHPLCNYCH